MSGLFAEIGAVQLSKTGEELCGDSVQVVKNATHTIIVLSDGLGSGVKANILSMMTTRIAASMLKRGIPLAEVVDTIAQTLPVCRERKIAYSTLQIIKIANNGDTSVVEFDSPASFLIRNGRILPFPTTEKVVAGKSLRIGQLQLQEGDMLTAVSDGVIHAGIGGLLKLGWGWQGVLQQLGSTCRTERSAMEMSREIIGCCEGYYLGRPGDDCTSIVVKLRQPVRLTLMAGPPADQSKDEWVVQRLLSAVGRKVISGGTTANIVSRVTGKAVTVDITYPNPDIPPTGSIEGVDLVTEGVLTLNAVAERLQSKQLYYLHNRLQDGATMLMKFLLEADEIEILAGKAINPAHQNTHFPMQINLKAQVLDKLTSSLRDVGKTVTIEWV